MKKKFGNAKIILVILLLLVNGTLLAQYKRIRFTEIKDIPEGKASVYIYRPYKFLGAAVHYEIKADGQNFSDIKLYVESYLIYNADPGKHLLTTIFGNEVKELPIKVEAGKAYFIEVNLGEFELVSHEDALPRIKKCDLFEKKTKEKK